MTFLLQFREESIRREPYCLREGGMRPCEPLGMGTIAMKSSVKSYVMSIPTRAGGGARTAVPAFDLMGRSQIVGNNACQVLNPLVFSLAIVRSPCFQFS